MLKHIPSAVAIFPAAWREMRRQGEVNLPGEICACIPGTAAEILGIWPDSREWARIPVHGGWVDFDGRLGEAGRGYLVALH